MESIDKAFQNLKNIQKERVTLDIANKLLEQENKVTSLKQENSSLKNENKLLNEEVLRLKILLERDSSFDVTGDEINIESEISEVEVDDSSQDDFEEEDEDWQEDDIEEDIKNNVNQ